MMPPLSRGSKIFVVGVAAFGLWATYEAGRNNPHTPPAPQSIEETIRHYGGCQEYRRAIHDAWVMSDQLLADLEKAMATEMAATDEKADIEKAGAALGLNSRYDELNIRSKKRALADAETAAACRRLQKLGMP
jgi:hypothetical protein